MKKNQNFKKKRNVNFLHMKGIFMCQNFVITRNFAIFAPHLAYEAQ